MFRTRASWFPAQGPEQDSSRVAASFNSLDNLQIGRIRAVGFAEFSAFFPVKDGWIRLHANYSHHRKALQAALGEKELEGIERALQQLSANKAEQLVNSAGGVASTVRSAQDWLQSDNAHFYMSRTVDQVFTRMRY